MTDELDAPVQCCNVVAWFGKALRTCGQACEVLICFQPMELTFGYCRDHAKRYLRAMEEKGWTVLQEGRDHFIVTGIRKDPCESRSRMKAKRKARKR